MLHVKGNREGRKNIRYTHAHKHIYYKRKKEKLKTITVLISTAGHMVTANIYDHLLPLPIPDSLCPQQAPQLDVVLCLVG